MIAFFNSFFTFAINSYIEMRFFLVFVVAITFFSSCTINKNVMFKTDQDYVFDQPDSLTKDYRISPNDILMIRVFANDGASIINATASEENRGVTSLQNSALTYMIDPEGKVKLPEVGEVELAGRTIEEAETFLELEYDEFHNDSFTQIRVMNNRIIVFPGSGGDAQVITLQNNNTTVIEALARAGGIADRGDASKVKLIRSTDEGDKIFGMDLSTIDGIQFAQMTVQANDIIYVEPVPEIASEVFKDVLPYVEIITSIALVWAVLANSFAN